MLSTDETKSDEQLNQLSSPWETLHHMFEAFFASDPAIVVSKQITDDYVLVISSYDKTKYNALKEILNTEFEFGNVTLHVELHLNSAKKSGPLTSFPETDIDRLGVVLCGNKLFERIETHEIMGSDITYCIFAKQVVQYYNDNIADPHGLQSTLAQDIAEKLFNIQGVFYCTDRI